MTGHLNYFGLYGANSSHNSPFWFLSQLTYNHNKTGLEDVTWTWGRNGVLYNLPLNWTHSVTGRLPSNCISSISEAGLTWWAYLMGKACRKWAHSTYIHTRREKRARSEHAQWPFSQIHQLNETLHQLPQGWETERWREGKKLSP